MRHLLLTGGPNHDFAATSAVVVELLAGHGFTTEVVVEPSAVLDRLDAAARGDAEPVDLLTVDALRWRMDQARFASLRDRYAVAVDDADLAVVERFVLAGGGLLCLHTAVICFDGAPRWRDLCGAVWRWDRSGHGPVAPVEVGPTAAGAAHELTAGLDPFVVEDEVYCDLDAVDDLVPLVAAVVDGQPQPLVWAREVGRGRVVTDLLGHGLASRAHPTHQDLLVRAATWAVAGHRARTGSEP